MSHDEKPQLHMVYPTARMGNPPPALLPAGYQVRLFQMGDEPRFYEVMALSGWEGWNDARLETWLARLLPDGWFFAVHHASGQIVASAMSLHHHHPLHLFGGELGWVASDPAHRGRGLGMTVCVLALRRLIAGGYHNIHLRTEDFRLPAIKTYLKLGFVPLLYLPEMSERWRTICDQLGWAFTPDDWQAARLTR